MSQPLKIFLSYSPDSGILPIGTPPVPTKVEKLYHRLQSEGFEPWLDKYDILPGEQLSDRNSTLMKSVPGNFVRQGATEGYINIQLQDTKNRSKTYTITTEIKNENGREIIRQKTEPVEDFPWGYIFACGYGAYRAAQAHASYDSYRTIEAVRSLFDSQVSLQNPEIVLLRRDPEVRQQLERKLLNILMLDNSNNAIDYAQQGLEMNGPWGKQPFEVLSDGYRSTTQWVLDFLGWAIHAERLSSDSELDGILLIDEIEQHLHPRWQRYIVQRLRQQFPKTQIIASTHTPLAASGMVDVDSSLLVKLEPTFRTL